MKWPSWRKYDIKKNNEVYLRRYFIWRCRWFSIFLHNIRKPDDDRDPHDHPWGFLGIVLRGGYIEERWHVVRHVVLDDPRLEALLHSDTEERNAGTIAYRKATDIHKIIYVRPNTWTLIFVGPKQEREWGFWRLEPSAYSCTWAQWVYWRKYLSMWDTTTEID